MVRRAKSETLTLLRVRLDTDGIHTGCNGQEIFEDAAASSNVHCTEMGASNQFR
jgi:hypothetical protein